MIRSMTGYGKGSAEVPGLRVTVELRSLNHRFADLRLRLPLEMGAEEAEIRRMVLSRVRRGRLEMSLECERSADAGPGAILNEPLVQAVVAAARTAKEKFGIEGTLDVNTLFGVPDVLRRGADPGEIDGPGQDAVRAALVQALDALDAERLREGVALRDEILARLYAMEGLVSEIRGIAAGLPSTLHRKLEERVESLAGLALDPARLAQEAAFLADRCDVTEELVRLEGHVRQSRALLDEPGVEPVGKRLDFLLQEIHRETNTINSKASDLSVSRRALALKSEAEKVREQIQNLE